MKVARRIASLLVFALLVSASPSSADAQGTVAGRVVAVSYPIDVAGNCLIDIETVGFPHTQIRVYLTPRYGQVSCPNVFFGDTVVIHFRLEPALCGPDLCAALWATAQPEKNL